jgi:hypothetical protein
MPKFMVLYRLHQDSSYDARRKSLLDAIARITPLTWDEATSFVTFECETDAVTLRDFLVDNSTLHRDERDKLYVLDAVVRAYATKGMDDEAMFNLTTGTQPASPTAVQIASFGSLRQVPYTAPGLGYPGLFGAEPTYGQPGLGNLHDLANSLMAWSKR